MLWWNPCQNRPRLMCTTLIDAARLGSAAGLEMPVVERNHQAAPEPPFHNNLIPTWLREPDRRASRILKLAICRTPHQVHVRNELPDRHGRPGYKRSKITHRTLNVCVPDDKSEQCLRRASRLHTCGFSYLPSRDTACRLQWPLKAARTIHGRSQAKVTI